MFDNPIPVGEDSYLPSVQAHASEYGVWGVVPRQFEELKTMFNITDMREFVLLMQALGFEPVNVPGDIDDLQNLSRPEYVDGIMRQDAKTQISPFEYPIWNAGQPRCTSIFRKLSLSDTEQHSFSIALLALRMRLFQELSDSLEPVPPAAIAA
jgi:hypothetical protein